MDRRLPRSDRGEPVTLDLEGDPVRAFPGESVAVALFASGVDVLARSIKYHRPRSFFCLSGSCGACLMRIDGVPNVRACRTPARDGLACERQNAFPSARHDALGVIDWIFRQGMDHHTLLTGSRTLNRAMQQVVLKLAGLGRLPERGVGSIPDAVRARADVLVVGAGPAGLAAAGEAARSGARTLLVEADREPGGRLLRHPAHGPRAARAAADEARAAGVEVWTASQAIAYYPEDEEGLVAVARSDALALVTARRTIYATGAYPVNAPFPDNDRPGVLAGAAVASLVVRHGVRPGGAALVMGRGLEADEVGAALRAAGVREIATVDGELETIHAVHGHSWVEGATVGPAAGTGAGREVVCDLIAVATPPSPASELPRQHGAGVTLDRARGGFAVDADEDGRTAAHGVLACGDVRGPVAIDVAREQGRRAGRAAATSLREPGA